MTRKRRKTSATNTKNRTRVALGLGANIGEARAALCAAARILGGVLQDARFASLYRSRPRSAIAQPDFFNTAVVGMTTLAPLELLRLGKNLEALAGRRPGPVDGPRPLDVDLLLFGEDMIESDGLVVPHPRLRERRFVLAPLAELEPAWAVPPDGATVQALLAGVGQENDVQRVGDVC